MNYRHVYHAGNFTEVFKHILLICLLQYLQRKETPICYIDTHAGIGNYDLHGEAAQKTGEYLGGIALLERLSLSSLPAAVATYLQLVKQWNTQQGSTQFRFYPGSPQLARAVLRSQDRIILSELHPEDAQLLKQAFKDDSQVAVHHMNGYHALKAFLPPAQSRGLLLMDPPFEKTDEFTQLVDALRLANTRWRSGVYAVWYPIKHRGAVDAFYRQVQQSDIRKVVRCELHLPYLATTGLSACGMLVVHPPWQWWEEVEQLLPWLCSTLSGPGEGSYKLEWLVPE